MATHAVLDSCKMESIKIVWTLNDFCCNFSLPLVSFHVAVCLLEHRPEDPIERRAIVKVVASFAVGRHIVIACQWIAAAAKGSFNTVDDGVAEGSHDQSAGATVTECLCGM